jgi:hypothetical protein
LAPIAACHGGAPAYGTPCALFTPLPPILQAKGWRRLTDRVARPNNKPKPGGGPMQELREMLREVIREELAARKKRNKAEFKPFQTFVTSEGVELEVSLAHDKAGQPIIGFVKRAVKGDEEVKRLGQFGFRLTQDVAAGLIKLITEKYPDLQGQPTKKKGRGA